VAGEEEAEVDTSAAVDLVVATSEVAALVAATSLAAVSTAVDSMVADMSQPVLAAVEAA
jgi:hypothetical protein